MQALGCAEKVHRPIEVERKNDKAIPEPDSVSEVYEFDHADNQVWPDAWRGDLREENAKSDLLIV